MRLQVVSVERYETATGAGTQVRYRLNGEMTVARYPCEMSFVQACFWVTYLWRPWAR